MLADPTFQKNHSIAMIIAAILALCSIGVGVWLFTNQMQLDSEQPTKLVTAPDQIPAARALSDQLESTPKPSELAMAQTGKYLQYTPENVANQKSGEKVVIFFTAASCATCQDIIQDIKENQANLPKNLYILSADFEKEIALKQKYAVSAAPTFVLINQDGQLIKKAVDLKTAKAIADFTI